MTSSVTRRQALTIGLLVLCAAAFVAPLLLMLSASAKPSTDMFTHPLRPPIPPEFGGYTRAVGLGEIPARGLNSVVITVTAVLLTTACGALVGYAIARARSRALARGLTVVFISGLVLPLQAGMVPLFKQIQMMHLAQSRVSLILIYVATSLPLTVLIFGAFFRNLPRAVEEAAMLDGAGSLRTLWSIVLPLAQPAVITTVIMNTVAIWNDYFIALVFTVNQDNQTLPLGLSAFRSLYHGTDWPAIMAYSAIIALPIILLYIFLQRYIIAGVTAGAGRG